MISPILISGGDPAGISPELMRGLLPHLVKVDRPVLYISGSSSREIQELRSAASEISHLCQIVSLEDLSRSWPEEPGLYILPVAEAISAELSRFPAEFRPGIPSERSGFLAFRSLSIACDLLCIHKSGDLLTLPLSKEWVVRAGIRDFSGHTGYLAERFGASVLMLLHSDEFGVIPLTEHIPVQKVSEELKRSLERPALPGLLKRLLEWPDYGTRPWFFCSLNPHGGEGGVIGREELEFLQPSVNRLKGDGLPIVGPLAADGGFLPGVRENYSLFLCAYHDQALAPFKALVGSRGVNCTIGLPFTRTSPDHGTAYSLVGSGRVDHTSTTMALAVLLRNSSGGRWIETNGCQ